MDHNKLAIVIPAYKSTYLQAALQTIVQQTDKNFIVYIGDDASPSDLWSIIQPFQNTLTIIYHRFDSNLGSLSLTKHWDRCIQLIANEEWVWLFSDDDLMPAKAVQQFYETLAQNNTSQLFRFNIDMVNIDASIILDSSSHPKEETGLEFCLRRLRGETISAACEYIFSRATYQAANGFAEFPLAWNADDASWITFSRGSKIYTINGAHVKWRSSPENITSRSKEFAPKMMSASLLYMKWLINFFKYDFPERQKDIIAAARPFFINQIKWLFPSLSFSELIKFTKMEANILEQSFVKLLYYNYKRLKRLIKF